MKEKIEEILSNYTDFNGNTDSIETNLKMNKAYLAEELSTLIQQEREEAVRGFATDFIETGMYEGVNSIEDIMKLWRKYNAHN